MPEGVRVRHAVVGDMKQVLELIVELAVYEKEEKEVAVTVDMLERDFENKLFEVVVAEEESNGKLLGFGLFYARYSTWKGATMYLEDFAVTQNSRGKGVGSLIFKEVARTAKERSASRLEWQVLEWNELAKDFYAAKKAILDPTWVNCKLTAEQLQKLY
eukprot:TRINITY_DN978_c9_g1_i1.p1 TRINITY_DN978_c9_g1~~TRINITY_DN978_c9_g1_i1.p1  ORF type:complete len:171 (+),score=41.63 TRINITY_DN978_c9_g1_i1:39-515(+)